MREVIFMLSKKDKEKKETECKINAMAHTMPEMNHKKIPSDVLGSYTGIAKDGDEPTQDADDI
jgi:hypothetical protein